MVVKTFRGLLSDSSPGNQNRIRLSTMKGKVGYRIVKFQLMGNTPGAVSQESVVKIYKQEQTTIDGVVDFTDTDMLAVAVWFNKLSVDFPISHQIIFDTEMFNQDIYVTHLDTDSAYACNYYIELEVIPLDDLGAEYTTVKDLRTQGL